MATISFGTESENPAGHYDIDRNTGGTLDSSNVVQVNYDDTVFTAAKGKERLLLALDRIREAILQQTWPTA